MGSGLQIVLNKAAALLQYKTSFLKFFRALHRSLLKKLPERIAPQLDSLLHLQLKKKIYLPTQNTLPHPTLLIQSWLSYASGTNQCASKLSQQLR
jgi:hypothetical protein